MFLYLMKGVRMNKKLSSWEDLTPEDLIEKMFERTDADGVLYMPSFFTEEHGDRASLRCVMSWELPGDCFSVLQEFDQLRSAIEQIAERCDRDGNMGEGGYDALSEKQKEVCNTYLTSFDSDAAFDFERIYEIREKLETIEDVREICKRVGAGGDMDQWSADYLRDYAGETVTGEEEDYFNRYMEGRIAEAGKRLGDHPFAYRTIFHAMRYWKLLTLEAPEFILNNEAKALASTLALLRWCKKFEYVDHAVRQHYDRLERMSEEELDALSRPKNANSRKSLVPLFVYLILLQHSGAEHPLRQQEIISYLADEPYEVVIERKTLSRVLHNLRDSQLGIYTDKRRGAWHMGGSLKN